MRNKKPQTSLTKAAWMLATALTVALPQAAGAETVMRIGMTAADIPRTLGQPDQGFEGNRFTGLTMYDGLTMWDLSSADKASVMIPGLATEWKVDDADKKKWVFKLRPGVTFHDGKPLTSADVKFTLLEVSSKFGSKFNAPGKAIKQIDTPDPQTVVIRLAKPFPQHLGDELVRHQRTRLHDRLGPPPKLAAAAHMRPQKIPGRDLRNTQGHREPRGLGALS